MCGKEGERGLKKRRGEKEDVASKRERREEWKGRYKWRRGKLTLLPQSVLGSAHSCTPGQMHLPVNRGQQ